VKVESLRRTTGNEEFREERVQRRVLVDPTASVEAREGHVEDKVNRDYVKDCALKSLV
jgi:hypothetical protein